MPHSLEIALNAPANDILDAIAKGFRAQADVKGKLAELYFARLLDRLRIEKCIDGYEWFDQDGKPDFIIHLGANRLVAEVKNIRSGTGAKFSNRNAGIVELQKTRNGLDAQGKKTRGYPINHFDLLAACLFNQTKTWEFRFAETRNLATRTSDPSILEIYQPVVYAGNAIWSTNLETTIVSALSRKST